MRLKVRRRRLGFAKIGFRYEFATKSLSLWLWKRRYTIYHTKKGTREVDPLAFVRKIGWRKTGNLA